MKIEDRWGWIYVITNLLNGKEYVGQTIRTVLIRWAEHVKAAFVDNNQKPLYRAMRKYGLKNFTVEAIWHGPEAQLNAAEKRFVRQRKTFIDWGMGYNLTTGGDHYKMSKRTIVKMRLANKVAQNRPDVIAAKKVVGKIAQNRPDVKAAKRISQTLVMQSLAARAAISAELSCRTHSVAHNLAVKTALNKPGMHEVLSAAISAAHKGVSLSAPHRVAISKVQKVVQNRPEIKEAKSTRMKGRKLSSITKSRMSATQKIVQSTLEVRAAKSAAGKIAQNRPEVKAANSARMKGHPVSTATRKKLAKAAKRQWADKNSRAVILAAIRSTPYECSDEQRARMSAAAKAYCASHPVVVAARVASMNKAILGTHDTPEVRARKSAASYAREAARRERKATT